jgi:hypothetical protein
MEISFQRLNSLVSPEGRNLRNTERDGGQRWDVVSRPTLPTREGSLKHPQGAHLAKELRLNPPGRIYLKKYRNLERRWGRC